MVNQDPATEMGPAISAGQKQTVMDYIAIGREGGAHLVCGGKDLGPEQLAHFMETKAVWIAV